MAKLVDNLDAISEVLAGPATDDAAPVVGSNLADITDTSVQSLLAAPATGKRYRITQVIAHNRTAAESPIIVLEDGTAAEIVRFQLGAGGAPDSRLVTPFNPPLLVAVDQAVNGKATTAVGDTTVTVLGFEETPV